MTAPKVGLRLPDTEERSVADFARLAERSGYHSAWISELWGEDAFVKLAEIAMLTEELNIGTSIVNVFSRSPATLAMAGTTLQELSDRRFTMGLGVSTPKAVEDLHGFTYERPLRHAHECISIIREYASPGGDAVTYDGEIFSVADFRALDSTFPIYNAALGPANRRLTGRLCDGWMPHNLPLSYLPTAFEEVETGAVDAGRDPDDVRVIPFVPAAVSEDAEEARRAASKHLAWYVSNGEGYRRAASTKFADTVDDIVSAWREKAYDRATSLVSDEMLDDLAITGTPEEGREKLRAIVEDPIVDQLILRFPRPASDDLVETSFHELAKAL